MGDMTDEHIAEGTMNDLAAVMIAAMLCMVAIGAIIVFAQ